MGYQPLETLLEKANYSVYRLVKLASKRAMELADGKPRLVNLPVNAKLATVALEEISAGKVFVKEVAERFASVQKKSSSGKKGVIEKGDQLEHAKVE